MANLTRGNLENGKASPARRDEAAWDPFSLMREMLRWDPFRGPVVGALAGGFEPRFEMAETEDAYVFTADLPGVEEEDVEISLTGDRLTISGHREQEHTETRARTVTSERSFGHFTRTFTLPAGTDRENISADVRNGVLNLTIPKRPENQPRRIAIKKGEGRGRSKGKA
jgi:HSP20 family protein